MIDFTAITFEVLVSGAWVDISRDVLKNPQPKFSNGMRGNGITDMVADPGTLTFSLNNSEGNSAGLIGRYSPGHANCLPGWGPTLHVRLSFRYQSWRRVKWFGYIEPEGIKVIVGTLNDRRVEVSCVNYIGLLANYKVNLMTLRTNQYMSGAINALLATIYHQPDRKIYNDAGALMPVVFDTSTVNATLLGELQKIAISEAQYIVLRGGGNGENLCTLDVSSDAAELPTPSTEGILSAAGDHILSAAGERILANATTTYPITNADMLPDTSISYGRNIVNSVTGTTYPRRPDAAATTVLWTLDTATLVAANSKLTMRGRYNDPTGGATINGTDFVNPLVSGTDYMANANEDGSGADKTSQLTITASPGAAESEFVLENTGGTDLWVGGNIAGKSFLQIRGRGIHIEDTARVVISDAASIRQYGERPLTIDMKYRNAPDINPISELISPTWFQRILVVNKAPLYSFDNVSLCANRDERNIFMFMYYEPRDHLQISDTMTNVSNSDQMIQGYEATIVAGKYVYWNFTGKASGL